MPFALSLLGLCLAVVVTRRVLLHRVQAPLPPSPFEGQVHQVGEAHVAERISSAPRATVICMHGFLENFHYFTDFYGDPDVQLIVISSADYYAPGPGSRPHWAAEIGHLSGTIEYDAAVLTQALQHLPRTKSVRVHGHSRGGAVVLEAARQRPELFREVEVVLEAPVLPGGRVRGRMNPALLWAMPLFMPFWRFMPMPSRFAYLWGRMESEAKRALIASLPFNPRRVSTIVRNLESIHAWLQSADEGHYEAVQGTVLIAGKDRVLDSKAMQTSAERAGQKLAIVHAPHSSHSVLFDDPHLVPPLKKD